MDEKPRMKRGTRKHRRAHTEVRQHSVASPRKHPSIKELRCSSERQLKVCKPTSHTIGETRTMIKPTSPDRGRLLGVTKVPFGLNHSTTNFVLNQRAGKLPLKDLSAFIREQAVVDDGRKAQDEAGDAQAQELRFEKQYRDVERRDKEKELKGMVAIGEDLCL